MIFSTLKFTVSYFFGFTILFTSFVQASVLPELEFNSSNKQVSVLVLPLKTPTELKVSPQTLIYIKDRILKIRTQGQKTYLVGQKPGFTFFRISDFIQNVKVLSDDEWSAHLNFQKIFKDHPNLKLQYTESDTTVQGTILLETDLVELLHWIETYKVKPRFKLEFIQDNFKKTFLDLLSEKLGTSVVDFDESMNLKLNRTLNKVEKGKVESLGFNLSQDNQNGLELGVLDIQFMNISDSELKNATAILPSSFQWTLDEKVKLLSQVIDSDYSTLNSMNNRSSLINLMLFENEKTEYHSGGEFAIQQRSIYRNDVQWKTYGLFVEALPISLSSDEIVISLKFKVSYVVSSDLNQPSLSQDSWTQKLRLKKNKSLVVSNSFTNMFVKDKKSHALFESIPVLRSLFHGRNSNKEKANIYMVIKINSNP